MLVTIISIAYKKAYFFNRDFKLSLIIFKGSFSIEGGIGFLGIFGFTYLGFIGTLKAL